jgi:hypothetical protein
MFSQYSQQIFLLAIFFSIVYSIVEVIKNAVIALPDKWGKVFKVGFGKKINKWISFGVSYLTAYLFDYRFAELIFKTINGRDAVLSKHFNYFIVSCLLFVGAKAIHKKIKSFYTGFTEDENKS